MPQPDKEIQENPVIELLKSLKKAEKQLDKIRNQKPNYII